MKYDGDITRNLEATIREINDSFLQGQSASVGRFAGLEYVIGAYLVNAARHDAEGAVQFIESLCPQMAREFLANMPIFFRRMETGFIFAIAPPEAYRRLAMKMTHSTNEDIAATAARVVDRLAK